MKNTLPHSPDEAHDPVVKTKSEEKKESLASFAQKLTGVFKTKTKVIEPVMYCMFYYYHKTNGERWMGMHLTVAYKLEEATDNLMERIKTHKDVDVAKITKHSLYNHTYASLDEIHEKFKNFVEK